MVRAIFLFSVFLSSIALALAYSPEEELLFDTFPDDFLWGSATAAYQVTQTFFHTKSHFASRPDRGRLERGRQGSEHLGRVHQGDCPATQILFTDQRILRIDEQHGEPIINLGVIKLGN